MLKRLMIFLFILSLTVVCVVAPVSGDEPALSAASESGCKGTDALNPYLGKSQLVSNVESAFLYELNSDSLLYAWDADLPEYPASFVKIMTALLVLENSSLSDVVTVSENAVNSVSYEAISANLVPGEKLTVEDLLYCMMVKSANDAAAVLAEHVSGSQGAFVSRMNARAAELGCTGTNYVNVHGLHDDQQVTTARDTCKILRAALQNDTFRTIFGTTNYTVPATNLNEQERKYSSNNYLMCDADNVSLYLDSRVTGGRTGVTTEGYRCIASLAKEDNMEVICIVMGCASTFLENGKTDVYGGFPETISLLNHAFEGNAFRQIVFKDQNLKQIPVLNGDSDLFVTTNQGVSVILPSDYSLKDLDFRYIYSLDPIQAPISKGQNIGVMQVMHDSVCIAESELYAANDVPVAYSKQGSYIDVKQKNYTWLIILIVLVVVIGAAVTWYAVAGKRRKQRREIELWRSDS